jgi:hypothetical protein
VYKWINLIRDEHRSENENLLRPIRIIQIDAIIMQFLSHITTRFIWIYQKRLFLLLDILQKLSLHECNNKPARNVLFGLIWSSDTLSKCALTVFVNMSKWNVMLKRSSREERAFVQTSSGFWTRIQSVLKSQDREVVCSSARHSDLQISKNKSHESFVSYQVTNKITNYTITNWPRPHVTGQ